MMNAIKKREKQRAKMLTRTREGRISRTQPNMSLTLRQVVERYVKSIPVDVSQRKGVYTNADSDLERLSRLDRTDQAYAATEYKARAQELEQRLETMQREKNERAKEEQERAQEQRAQRETGIDTLDNTMPDDTTLEHRPLGGSKGGRKSSK